MEMNLPNKLTLLRIILIPVFIIILSIPSASYVFGIPLMHLLAAIIFAFASATDWLDGYLARRDNLVTNFGKFADPLADKMLVMTAFIMLVGISFVPAWVAAVIICRELAVTGLRLLLVENGGAVLAAAMPGKIKTATQMVSIILLLLGFQTIGTIVLYICLFFTIYSGYDYFAKNMQVFKDVK